MRPTSSPIIVTPSPRSPEPSSPRSTETELSQVCRALPHRCPRVEAVGGSGARCAVHEYVMPVPIVAPCARRSVRQQDADSRGWPQREAATRRSKARPACGWGGPMHPSRARGCPILGHRTPTCIRRGVSSSRRPRMPLSVRGLSGRHAPSPARWTRRIHAADHALLADRGAADLVVTGCTNSELTMEQSLNMRIQRSFQLFDKNNNT